MVFGATLGLQSQNLTTDKLCSIAKQGLLIIVSFPFQLMTLNPRVKQGPNKQEDDVTLSNLQRINYTE